MGQDDISREHEQRKRAIAMQLNSAMNQASRAVGATGSELIEAVLLCIVMRADVARRKTEIETGIRGAPLRTVQPLFEQLLDLVFERVTRAVDQPLCMLPCENAENAPCALNEGHPGYCMPIAALGRNLEHLH